MLSSPYIIHVTTISVTVFKASSMILIRNDPLYILVQEGKQRERANKLNSFKHGGGPLDHFR